jgi:cyclomaltodextrinase / maltogenic alpha-amylase / neopullulanase
MNNSWAKDAFFYQIYPLGFCGAPVKNGFTSEPVPRFEKMYEWIEHLTELGVNAVYIGPVFESTMHGYDTADYYKVDRRLGTNQTLKKIIERLHSKNIRVVLDGVFNHVGRDFWAFKDVQANLSNSAYCDWFQGLSFNGKNQFNEPFIYEGWNGHYELVKLNLLNNDIVQHIFGAVKMWINELGIDGLRLDAADCLDKSFIRQLAKFCKEQKNEFWLMGEIIHGDYNEWAGYEMLDSVTNYECYKGLYSSHNDKNYFEIAYSFQRQFGAEGKYKNLYLYNFVDNHDVNRAASILTSKSHLFPMYFLLFTMPGIPSVYYGSEFGIEGKKENNSDLPLRPSIDLNEIVKTQPVPELFNTIKKLAGIRKNTSSLRYGTYKQVFLKHQLFAFLRETKDEAALVAVNSQNEPVEIEINLQDKNSRRFIDQMTGEEFYFSKGLCKILLHPNWGRILIEQK